MKGMSQRNKDSSSCRSGEIKHSLSCRSGEISTGVDRNVSDEQVHLVDQVRSVVVLI